jgi:hypothetical protein
VAILAQGQDKEGLFLILPNMGADIASVPAAVSTLTFIQSRCNISGDIAIQGGG